jgi:hypothetical protein
MKNILSNFIAMILIVACNTNLNQNCTEQNSKEFVFYKDSIRLGLPPEWSIIDSTYFHDQASIYSRRIMNDDSSSFALITISDYSVYPNFKINQDNFFGKMKAKMQERNNKRDSLIDDDVREIKGHDINFLKYLNGGSSGKVYGGHIGFLLPEKKQVEIEIRSTGVNSMQAEKVIDCIFLSLKIK